MYYHHTPEYKPPALHIENPDKPSAAQEEKVGTFNGSSVEVVENPPQSQETYTEDGSMEPVSSSNSTLNRNGSQEYHSQELDRPSFVNHPEDGLLQDSKKYPLQIWFNPSRDRSDSEPPIMSLKEEPCSLSELRKNDPSPLTEEEVEIQIKALELGWENAGKQFLDTLNTIERFRTTSPTTREAVQDFIRAGEQFYGKELMQYALGEDYSGEKSTLSAERVQEILNKADTVIRNAVLFLRECPYIPSNTIQDLALHKEIQQELDPYKEAYQELGPKEQHLIATVYHGLETGLRGIGVVGIVVATVVAAEADFTYAVLDFPDFELYRQAITVFAPHNAATRTREATASFMNSWTLETKIKNLETQQDKLSERILQETGGARKFANDILTNELRYPEKNNLDGTSYEKVHKHAEKVFDIIVDVENALDHYLERIDARAAAPKYPLPPPWHRRL